MPQVAAASSIVIFNTQRSTAAASADDRYFDADHWSNTVTGSNSSGGGSASQDTDISTFMGGTGTVTVISAPNAEDTVFGRSTLFTEFTLFQHYTADLTIDLFSENGLTLAVLRAFDGSVHWNAFTNDGLVTLERHGTLLPGRYSFRIDADASSSPAFSEGQSTSSFNGGLTLTPIVGTEIPEPATLSLFGIGLLGAAVRKRCTKGSGARRG
jgi:hypothetical protein